MPSDETPRADLERVVRRAVRAELHALVFKLFWTALAVAIVVIGANTVAIGLFGIGSGGSTLALAFGAVTLVFGARVLLSTWDVTLF